jgi:hypothetical protein
MRLNFSDKPVAYEIMTVAWYVLLEEGRLLPYGANKFLWVYIKLQIMSYVPNIIVFRTFVIRRIIGK